MNAKNRTIFLIAGVCAVAIAIALTLVLTLKQPHVHAYGDPTYAWSTENGEQYCTATKTCSSCKDGATGHEISEKVAAKVMVTQSRTCTLPELADLKAEFTVEGFTSQTRSGEQTKPATGHSFSEALTATADEHYHACENAGCTATEGNAAHSPSQDYVIVAEATCSEKGRKAKVCADCGYEIDPIEIAIDETKHAYGDPIYVWSNDFGKCTGKIVCAHNAAHEITEEGFVVKPGDPRTKGKDQITYTAYFDPNSSFTEQTHTENYSAYEFETDDAKIAGLVFVREKSVSFICTRDSFPENTDSNVDEVNLIDEKNGIYSITLSSYRKRNFTERYLVTLNDSTMKTVAFKPSSLGVAYEDYTFAAGHPNETDAKIRVYTDNDHSYADLIAIDTAAILETYICKIDKEKNVLIADGKYYTIGANNVLSVKPEGDPKAEYSFTYDEDGINYVTYEFRKNGFMYIKVKPAGKTEYTYVEAYKYTAVREDVFIVDEGINRKAFSLYKINNMNVVKPIELNTSLYSVSDTKYEFNKFGDCGINENIYFTGSSDASEGTAYITMFLPDGNGVNSGNFLVCTAYWKRENNVITLYDDEKVNDAKKYDRTFESNNNSYYLQESTSAS